MADYISREAAKQRIRDSFPDLAHRCEINAILNSIPAADVRPVVRGRWEWNKHYGRYQCSNCHTSYVDIEWDDPGDWKYCPSCGADMREVSEDG